MSKYTYGEEVEYSLDLLQIKDKNKVKQFTCGNSKLDAFIQNDIIPGDEVINEDGLIFKAEDNQNGKIIAIISIAASGIVFTQTNYMKLLPSVKIDIFAVDVDYQKMHYNEESANDKEPDNHFYLSDSILAKVIQHCKEISEKMALVEYILLYADRKAYRFYERNGFQNFEAYMEKENNMEINQNIPMYMKL